MPGSPERLVSRSQDRVKHPAYVIAHVSPEKSVVSVKREGSGHNETKTQPIQVALTSKEMQVLQKLHARIKESLGLLILPTTALIFEGTTQENRELTLTQKERVILGLVKEGKSTIEIALYLSDTSNRVKRTRANIAKKLGLPSLAPLRFDTVDGRIPPEKLGSLEQVQLSPEERHLFSLLQTDPAAPEKELAEELGISSSRVKIYFGQLGDKLGVFSFRGVRLFAATIRKQDIHNRREPDNIARV